MATYTDLVDCYIRGCKTRLNCNLGFCKSLHECTYGYKTHQQGTDNISCCVSALPTELSMGKDKHYHQDRVPGNILKAFEVKVTAFPFKTYTTFDELFEDVAKITGYSLLTYDFCLRYGNNHGVRPKEYVYLFNGAKAGAEKLFGYKLPSKLYKKPIADFIPLLGTKLDAAEIEDFLCVCKDHIEYI